MKDYLGWENARNKQHAALYVAIMHEAFGGKCDVLIGHHLTFEQNGDLETENEIPSADTLMFDHEVMHRVFGPRAIEVMKELAALPADLRDTRLKLEFEALTGNRAVAA